MLIFIVKKLWFNKILINRNNYSFKTAIIYPLSPLLNFVLPPLFLLHPLKWQMLQVRCKAAPRIIYTPRAPRNLDPALVLSHNVLLPPRLLSI